MTKIHGDRVGTGKVLGDGVRLGHLILPCHSVVQILQWTACDSANIASVAGSHML